MQQYNNTQPPQQSDEETIDLGKLFFRFLSNWYWFLIVLVLSMGGAWAYLRYTTPVYNVSTSLLMEDDNSSMPFLGSSGTGSSNIFQGFGQMNSMRKFQNQIIILKSTPVINRTLQELDFEVSYFSLGRIAVSERYKEIPFHVQWQPGHRQLINTDFNIQFNKDGTFNLSFEGEDIPVYNFQNNTLIKKIPGVKFSEKFTPGDTIMTKDFSFRILLNEKFDPQSTNNFKFRFNTIPSLVKKYQRSLEINMYDKETSIIKLSLNTENTQKGIDFLNKLTEISG